MKILWFLLCPLFLFGQGVFKIPYGEHLYIETPAEGHIFSLSHNEEIIPLKGSKIGNYIFEKPGLYIVHIKDNHQKMDVEHENELEEIESCLHPKFGDSFRVEVDSVRIKFIPNSMELSKPIYKNKSTDDMYLLIDVEIENYYGTAVSMNVEKVNSAGIGSNISAKLVDKMKSLKPGNHTLKYKLEGICTEASYIQFDFKNHNGNIVPVALKKPVME